MAILIFLFFFLNSRFLLFENQKRKRENQPLRGDHTSNWSFHEYQPFNVV